MDMNATLIWQLVLFILFAWFCMKFVWPPIINAIEERQKSIANDLASAEEAKKEQANADLIRTDILNSAKIEAQKIIDTANNKSSQIIELAREEALELKKSIIDSGHVQLDSDIKKAKEGLRKEFASLTVMGVQKIIKRNLDDAANDEIIENLINKL